MVFRYNLKSRRNIAGMRQRGKNGNLRALKGRSKFRRKFKDYHEVHISRKDFIEWYDSQEKICAYCDIPEEHLELMRTDFDGRINRLEIDCVDNDLGYVSGNLALSCHRCNFVKLNFFSFDEMREIAQKYFKPSKRERNAQIPPQPPPGPCQHWHYNLYDCPRNQ